MSFPSLQMRHTLQSKLQGLLYEMKLLHSAFNGNCCISCTVVSILEANWNYSGRRWKQMLGYISWWGSLSPAAHVKLVILAWILGKCTDLGEREVGHCLPYSIHFWWHSSPVCDRHVPCTIIISTSHDYAQVCWHRLFKRQNLLGKWVS